MFSIDITNRTPIYKQLETSIIQYISLGILMPHEQLPSVRSLAQQLHINPNTVQKVYASLEQRRLVYMVPGRGAFISEQQESILSMQAMARDKLLKLSKEAKALGISQDEQLELIKQNFEEDEHDSN